MILTGACLLWPSLHLLYGTKETRTQKRATLPFLLGLNLLFISLLFLSFGLGLEQGLFYWLFAFMAFALGFVQLRIWKPKWVANITAISLIGALYGLV